MEYRDLAGLVDYHLSSPLMTEEQVHEGCMRAQSYEVRSVVVRPCDLDLAKEWVVAPVRLASRTSAAPGDATTAVKQFEVRDLLRRGAVDVEAKVNLPKMMSRQFQYVEIELMQLLKTCEEGGATLTASCDVSVLDEERLLILCKMAKRSGVSMLSASEYRVEQVEAMLKKCSPYVEVKLMVDGKTLEEVLALKEMGVVRFGVRHPGPLLDAWKLHLEAMRPPEEVSPAVIS
jgi:deoxyribose-phosphate aldolase